MKLIIFTYAPAGLGHLRVTDALIGSRPKEIPYVLLGANDQFLTWIHRFTSTNPLAKFIFESSQYGVFEDVFTWLYRCFLIKSSEKVYKEVLGVIEGNPQADEILIVATHFGMAHQIGAVKKKLVEKTGRKISLVVQVTDDTYQKIWCVDGADLTMVPSLHVKQQFEKYAKEQRISFRGQVTPYPIDIQLTEKLTSDKLRSRTFENNGLINVMVPISGAATGLAYLVKLIEQMVSLSKRYHFWLLVKKAPYTDFFVSTLSKIPEINILLGKDDSKMINLYELIYQNNVVHLEITKPSEQAFKAIIEPNRVGGSLLLFTSPVGRQEADNIDFLRRHNLIKNIGDVFLEEAHSLRSLILEENPLDTAKKIIECTTNGVFEKMAGENFSFTKESKASGEVGAGGAKKFWMTIQECFWDSRD